MVRGILATCYARPAAGRTLTVTGRGAGGAARRLRRRALRGRDRRPALDQGDHGVQRGARHRPGGPAYGVGASRCARSTTWSRARRARPSSAPTPRSASPRPPGCPSRGCTRERHRAGGLRGRRGLGRHQGGRRARRGRRGHRRRPGRPRRGRVHVQPGRGRARPGEPGPPRRLPEAGRRASILTSGNANAATGAPGRAAAERLCAAVAGDVGATAEEILVCQTGLIGIPFPIDAVMPRAGRHRDRRATAGPDGRGARRPGPS